MSDASLNSASTTQPGEAGFGDFLALLKPRVMTLVVFTALVGLLAAPVAVHPVVGLAAILFIAVGGGAAGALNMWWESDIDAIMKRTAGRPIPTGRVARDEAFAFGVTLAVFAVVMLWLATNALAAGLLAFTIFFYVVIYTIGLKRWTPQNIVIGGAAGATPPLLGWTAVTGQVDPYALVLFLIIFTWTPPHFWALAIYRKEEYAKAGIPMLPVTHGEDYTRLHILLYTILLLLVSLLPVAMGENGGVYLLGALALGAGFLRQTLRLLRQKTRELALKTFLYSIIYLPLLFACLALDRYLPLLLKVLPV